MTTPLKRKEAKIKDKRINILTIGQDILKDNTDLDCSINVNNCSIKGGVPKNPDVFKRKGIQVSHLKKGWNSMHGWNKIREMVFSSIPGCTQNGEGGDGKKLKTAAGVKVFT